MSNELETELLIKDTNYLYKQLTSLLLSIVLQQQFLQWCWTDSEAVNDIINRNFINNVFLASQDHKGRKPIIQHRAAQAVLDDSDSTHGSLSTAASDCQRHEYFVEPR